MRKRTLIFPVAFFISSFFILYFSSGAVKAIQDKLYNSDLLFPFSLYQSLFRAGVHPDWFFGSNTPYIDLFSGLILWLVFRGNVHLTLAGFAVLQPVLMAACWLYLAYCIFGKNWRLFSLILVFAALSIMTFSVGLFRSLFFQFTWYGHVSTLGLAVVSLGLVIQVAVNDQVFSEAVRIRLYGLCLLTALATTSDALFIVQFTAPVLVVLALMMILSAVPIKRGVVTIVSLLLGTGLGQALYSVPLLLGANRLSLAGFYAPTDWTHLFDALKIVLATISSGWDSTPWGWVIWAGFYLLCFAFVIAFAWQWRRDKPGRIRRRLLMMFAFFLVQSGANMGSAYVSGNSELRYFLPAIYIPLFWGWPFMVILIPGIRKLFSGKRLIAAGLSLIGIMAIFLWVNLNSSRALINLADYYPSLVGCVDGHARELGLHRGIAQYWYARYISILSKDNLAMVQETHAMAPFRVLNNSDGYEDDFDFVLAYSDAISMNRVDPANLVDRAAVIARFGEPAVSFNCDGVDMLVYNRENDQTFKRQFRLYMGFGNWK